jgi:hypothetical protein
MRFLNAIMGSCIKQSERESADGYFCFTLEHGVRRQTLLVRLMRRTLLSAQCLAGGSSEFFPDVQRVLGRLRVDGPGHHSSAVLKLIQNCSIDLVR